MCRGDFRTIGTGSIFWGSMVTFWGPSTLKLIIKMGAVPEERGLCTAAADKDLAAIGLPVGRATVDGFGCRVGELQRCGVDHLCSHPANTHCCGAC